MNKKTAGLILSFIIFDTTLAIWLYVRGHNVALLNPSGLIALQEKNLILTAISIMLLVAIPTFIFLFFISFKYRSSNTKAIYSPNMTHGTFFQLALWTIPSVIVVILAVILWQATHALDPYKSLDATAKPLTIQVIALRWKWLFIYPMQHIATVNFIEFPVHTPISFQLTADGPMSSFWIPNLGGQMYAMTGMTSQLHLIADMPGEYNGSSAEINGAGFAGMKFIANASSQADFDTWVQLIQQSHNGLTLSEFNRLSQPSADTPQIFYATVDNNLYNHVVMKYMEPTQENPK